MASNTRVRSAIFSTQGSAFEALLALMLSDKVGDQVKDMPARDPRLDHARDAIRDRLVGTLGS